MNEPSWLTYARQYIGTTEIPGARHNPVIVRWWSAIRSAIRDDETPWCAAFVGGVLEELGFRSSRNAAARSYMTWGTRMDYLATGAVVVLSRPPHSWSGHVGFLVGLDNNGRLLILGGNQGNTVSIAAFDMQRLIGIRWPAPVTEAELPLRFSPVRRLAFDKPSSVDES